MYSSAFGGVLWDSCNCKSLNVLNASSDFTDLTLVVGGLWEARVLRRLLCSLLEDALGKIQVGSHWCPQKREKDNSNFSWNIFCKIAGNVSSQKTRETLARDCKYRSTALCTRQPHRWEEIVNAIASALFANEQ